MRKFVKDLASYAPSQLLPALTAFFTTPILTRLFPPAEYGYWALASSVAAFLVALSVSGLGSAVIRFYPSHRVTGTLDVFLGTLRITAVTIIGAVAAVSILLLLLLRTVLAPGLVPLLPLVILIFVAQSAYSVGMALLRAQGRSGLYTVFQLVAYYGGLGAGLLLVVFAGFRVSGLLWGTLLSLALVLPFLFGLAAKNVTTRVGRWRLADALHVWEYAWPLTLGNVAMWGLRVSDLFILSALQSARDVGLYSVSYSISARSIELLVAMFLLGVSPFVYRTWEAEGQEATEQALSMITRIYLILCLPAAVGLTVLAVPFVALLTTPDYYDGSRIVGFVVFSSFAWGLANIAMMGLTIKKRAARLGANQVIAAAIHVGLQLLFVPRFGYVASAVSTLIGYTALLFLNASASHADIAWRFPFRTLLNVSVASSLMGAAAWGIYGSSHIHAKASAIRLLLTIGAAVPIYGVCLWLLGEARDEEKRSLVGMWYGVSGR